MIQHVQINDWQEKVTAKGQKFMSFQTDRGTMSCWDERVAVELTLHKKGTVFELVTETKGSFTNILGVEGIIGHRPPAAAPPLPLDDRTVSTLTSYVKDLVSLNISLEHQAGRKASVDELGKFFATQVADWYLTIKKKLTDGVK